MDLIRNLSSIKGIGPKTEKLLNNCGIFSLMDLLLYFPRAYERISIHNRTNAIEDGEKIIISCTVIRIERDIKTRTGKLMSTVVFKSNSNSNIIIGRWFNQPYMKEKFIIGNQYNISGKIKMFRGEAIISNPVVVNNFNDENKADKPSISQSNRSEEYKIVPIYSLTEGLTNSFFIKVIGQILKEIRVGENFPVWILEKYNFCPLDKAIRSIHNPLSMETLEEARRRLKFQELFTYSLKILMLKNYINNSKSGVPFSIAPELKELKENLPFKLTNAQSRVMREILLDQKRERQMNRLVQGDVGSGKTIVAIISMFNVVKNGYQTAMMAPTEILANQHYNEVVNILKPYNLNIQLLCGSTTQKSKEVLKADLKEGKIDILVGTHALLEEDVEFKNLGMVVTDEQHRFGVMQRSKLFNKGKNIDVLVMTATPIPRTLALYLYGDLDVSIIDELPPGRQKIDTSYVSQSKRDKVYKFALKEVEDGRQIYVVCPLVEHNEELSLNSVEKLYKDLTQNYFKESETAFLHGKMPNKTKDEIMNKFKEGIIKVLVSTTVIEVGINVPNATVMIIENAERFGLAQLHQLRGRVGRGAHKSYCILVADIKNETIEKRLQILQDSNDGFAIAEEDLKIRGSGELFGFRQHGENSLILADIIEDIELLKKANMEAKILMQSKNNEDIKVKNDILRKLEQTSKFICFN